MERAVCDSSRAPGSQKSVDQFRQLVAVAAFENRGSGNADLTQPIAELREVFVFQCHLHEWIAGVSIETSRNKNQIRLECDKFFQRSFRNIDMLRPRRERSHRIIVDVRKRFRARSRISGKLVNGRKSNSWMIRDYRFRAVAVVCVE